MHDDGSADYLGASGDSLVLARLAGYLEGGPIGVRELPGLTRALSVLCQPSSELSEAATGIAPPTESSANCLTCLQADLGRLHLLTPAELTAVVHALRRLSCGLADIASRPNR